MARKKKSRIMRVGEDFHLWMVCEYMPELQQEWKRIPSVPEATNELVNLFRKRKNHGIF